MSTISSGLGRGHYLAPVRAGMGVMLIVLGCSAGATPAPTQPAVPADLDGTSWRLTEYVTPDRTAYTVPASVTPGATFAAGSISGYTGCNRYTASYTIDGSTIDIGEIATTSMACVDPLAGVEAAYLEALGLVNTFVVSGDKLTMTGTGDTPSLTFVRGADVVLVGPTWVATGINTGTGGVASVVEGVEVTAVFAADGTVSGSGGCNTYNGPFTTDGETIRIGPLASTKKLCGSPDGVDDQEATFLTAMQAATKHLLAGYVLQLRADDDALLVEFQTQQ
jgi:heat shock protein HslJ